MSKNYLQSIETLTKEIERESDNHEHYLHRALCYLDLKKWIEALEDTKYSIKLNPCSRKAWYAKSIALLNLNNFEEAIESAQNAFYHDSTNEDIFKLLYQILFEVFCLSKSERKFITDQHIENVNPLMIKANTIVINTTEDVVNEKETWTDSLFALKGSPLHKILEAEKHIKVEIQILSRIATCMEELNQFQFAGGCLCTALYLAKRINDGYNLSALGGSYCVILFKRSEISKAKEHLKTILEENNEKYMLPMVRQLNYMGTILIAEGKYYEASLVLKRCISLAKANGIEKELANAAGSLGNAYLQLGKINASIEQFQISIDLSKKLKDFRMASILLGNFGQVFVMKKNYELALSKINEAISIYPTTSTRMNQSLNLAGIYLELAMSHFGQDKNEFLTKAKDALEFGIREAQNAKDYKRLSLLYENFGELAHLGGGEHKPEIYFKLSIENGKKSADAETLVNAIVKYGFYLYSVKNKSEALNILLEADNLFDEIWKDIKQDSFMISWSNNAGPSDCYKLLQILNVENKNFSKALEISEKGKARALKTEFERREKHLDKIKCSTFSYEEIKARAKSKNLFIVYYSIVSEINVFVWLIAPDGVADAGFIQLDNCLNLNEERECKTQKGNRCSKQLNFREFFGKRTFEIEPKLPKECNEQQIRTFYQCLWQPFEDKILQSAARRVVVVADAELYSVPFSMFRNAASLMPIIENYSLTLSPNLSIITNREQAIANFQIDENSHNALIVANPQIQSQLFSALPFSETECHAVEDILKDYRITSLVGAAATKARVLEELPKATTFHLATHATADANETDEIPGAIIVSKADSDQSEDAGIITANEIQTLDLSRLQLAFLNCCFTGCGNLNREGLVGLCRAFLFAGAREVVACLQPVPDTQTTCDFVDAFYRHYVQSGEADLALQHAQRMAHERGFLFGHAGNYFVFKLFS